MLYRTILLTSTTGMLVTAITLALLVTTSWLGVQRLDPLPRHVVYQEKLDAVRDALAERFVARPSGTPEDRRFISRTADRLERLAAGGGTLAEGSADLIGAAVAALREAAANHPGASAGEAPEPLAEALTLVGRASRAELAAHRGLLTMLADYGDRQLMVSVALALVIPAAAAALLLFFRRRVLAPLNDLRYLMGLLSRKDYAAAMTEEVDPLMAPLFEQYNRMVRRMRDLDAGHVKREDALQQDVDDATRALIRQQVALARAERMAAVGDVSARLAHNLRNPLSGVLMALTNLRGEVDSAEQRERLGVMIGELERATRLLANWVEESRQVPELPARLQLSRVINDLVKLLRYQLDPGIVIDIDVPEQLYCRLPEADFRHVLLNLVLNAAQAIGKGPGTIAITAGVRGDRIELAIRDDGPGFPEELLELGVHEHGSWRSGGTGLGLATARRFALAHGSRLELKSRDGAGATAVLVLPAEDCDE